MKTQCRYFIVLIILGILSFSVIAKQDCQKYLNKVRSIQEKQRAGYNVKQGNKLQAQATKARDKWWRCSKGTVPNKKAKKKSKKHKKKQKKNSNKNKKIKKRKSKKNPPTKVFNTSRAIIIKNRYKGSQLQAWLDFYQQPLQCKKPKTTKIFAYCIENEHQQQQSFERNY